MGTGCPTLLGRPALDQSDRRSHSSAERTTVDPTMLARWQFATTTVYHFLIVPISIGLTALVAGMQTLAYLKRGTPAGEQWDRSARFWGRLMLILFALGVVTGIVQEFQFGM